MRFEVGKEIEYARHRLNDIVYLAEKTAPADAEDWEGYAKSLRDLIVDQARQALTALSVIQQ